MIRRPFPKKIYVFDINGTLDFENINSNLVPAKIAFAISIICAIGVIIITIIGAK